MLTLTLHNRNIPLPRNFSMRLTVKSPFFEFEKIPMSYSLDFSLPMTNEILAIFAHPERITRRRYGSDQKFSGFEVRFKGSLFLAGSITVTISSNTLSCTAVDVVGVLSDATRERSVLDIAKFAGEIDFVNSANFSPDTHPYCCFPIINQEFFKDKGINIKRKKYVAIEGGGTEENGEFEMEALTFCFLKTVGAQVNALNTDKTVKQIASTIDISDPSEKNASYMSGEVTVVSPFFFLNYVIKAALKANNLHLVENFIQENPELKNICLYNDLYIPMSLLN